METSKRNAIVLSLGISLIFTFIITRTVFFSGIPKINAEKVRRIAKNTRDSIIIFKNTIAYKILPRKIDYYKTHTDYYTADYKMKAVVPAQTITPTEFLSSPTIISSTPTPTNITTPTPLLPTQSGFEGPAEIILVKISPTATPKVKKKSVPTSAPIPTWVISDKPAQTISNPLDQPYYNPSKAYLCFNTKKFIEVYADNVTPDSCYKNVKSRVESNLISINLLGHSIIVHRKAYPAFKAVADSLELNPVAKKYKIDDIGTYVFRCNVNTSTSTDKYDTCSSGCILSTHAFGISVDINADRNCNGCSNFDIPPEVVDIFEKYGFSWGGRFNSIFGSKIDPMHFEYAYDLCKDLN